MEAWEAIVPEHPGTARWVGEDGSWIHDHGAVVGRYPKGEWRFRPDHVNLAIPPGAPAPDAFVTVQFEDFTPDEEVEEPGASAMVDEGGA
jgi:hypothetical protein